MNISRNETIFPISRSIQSRLRRAFKLAAELRNDQFQYFSQISDPLTKLSSSTTTEHHWDTEFQPPEVDWSLAAGEIFNHLSSLKDNAFKEIAKTFSAGNNINAKTVRSAYWPSCNSAEDWSRFEERYSFIPASIMDRIEVLQPFRDVLPPEPNSSSDEYRKNPEPSASTWARRLNNSDKHDSPIDISVWTYANGSIVSLSDFTVAAPYRIRESLEAFATGEPLLKIFSEPVSELNIAIERLDIQVMQRVDSGMWGNLNYNIWQALLENFAIICTLCRGQDFLHANLPPWLLVRPTIWSDFSYFFNGTSYEIQDVAINLPGRSLADESFWALIE